MNCKDIGELLISYLDGELAQEEKEIVELHLSACPRCRQELESLAATQSELRQTLETVTDKTPSVQAWARLQQRLASEEQSRVNVFNLAKAKLRREVDIVKGRLISRQPVWKSALAGAVVVALIAGLALTIPPLLGQPQEVLAAEIAQNDPQIRELLPEGTVVRVMKIVKPGQGGIFHVLFLISGESVWGKGDEGEATTIDAVVDVRERKVVGLKAVKTEEVPITPLRVEDKKKAVGITMADYRVQEILNGGAKIQRVIPLPFFQPSDGALTVNAVGVVLIKVPPGSQARAERWIVQVDLTEGKVINIVERLC